jgi:hypothetical protein
MREALRNSTDDGEKWELGGWLRVEFTKLGPASESGGNQPKDYEAQYTAPSPEDAPPPPEAPDDPWS